MLLKLQVVSLKDTIAMKDEEIEQLQQMKGGLSKQSSTSLKHSSSSEGGTTQQEIISSSARATVLNRVDLDQESYAEQNDEHSDQSESLGQSKVDEEVGDQNSADPELLGYGDADSEERLSDSSDGGLSMGIETEGYIGSVTDSNLFPEQANASEATKDKV